mmetsp:Transcript_2761/g.3182  ORF Transcript_2761/g.3182 Transcript_2761/m.3182 type:complete len:110 (-) Transcript_2761:262-591(-)
MPISMQISQSVGRFSLRSSVKFSESRLLVLRGGRRFKFPKVLSSRISELCRVGCSGHTGGIGMKRCMRRHSPFGSANTLALRVFAVLITNKNSGPPHEQNSSGKLLKHE